MGCSALCIDVSGIPSPQNLFPIKHIQPGSKITVRTFGFLKLLRDTMAKIYHRVSLASACFHKKKGTLHLVLQSSSVWQSRAKKDVLASGVKEIS